MTPYAHGQTELRISTSTTVGSIHLTSTHHPGWLTVSQVVTRPTKTGLGTLLYRQAFAMARQTGYKGLASVISERTRAGDAFWARLRTRAVTHIDGDVEYLTGWRS